MAPFSQSERGSTLSPVGESLSELTLSPVAGSRSELSKVDRKTLLQEQREDHSIKALTESGKLGTKKKDVSFHEESGLLHCSYTDVQLRKYEQFLVPHRCRRLKLASYLGGA